MKTILTLLAMCLISIGTYAQPPLLWQMCLGGTSNDASLSVRETTDNGFLISGVTTSNDGNVSGNHGLLDYWVVKISSVQTLLWQKCYGGTGLDEAITGQPTSDGKQIIIGLSNSNDGDVTGNHGGFDYWIVKIDQTGAIMWQKCLGGSGGDAGAFIEEVSSGGYIACGYSNSNDGNVSGNHGGYDFWVVRMDASGSIDWQTSLGGSMVDEAWKILETPDGGFLVVGYTESNDGQVSGNHGMADIWVVKLDVNGTLQWQKCYGGTNNDYAYEIELTPDGGFILAGQTDSNDGDVSGNHGMRDYWIVKCENDGDIQWDYCFGGSLNDFAKSIEKTNDNCYLITGHTYSSDGNVAGNHGGWDVWLLKLDLSGNIKWQKCLGGSAGDAGSYVIQTTDGSYIIAGYTNSTDGDVVGNHGAIDFWIVKLQGTSGENEMEDVPYINLFPVPAEDLLNIDLGIITENARLSVLSPGGKTVIPEFPARGNSIQMDVRSLVPGTYILKVSIKENILFRKFSVTR